MRNSHALGMLLVVLVTCTIAGSAQSQSNVQTVSPHAIDLSRVRPTLQPNSVQFRSLVQNVAAAPAKELFSGATVVQPGVATAPVPVPQTEKGKLYHVDLGAADDRTISTALASQPAIRAQGNVLVPLPGVFRQLAVDGAELLLKPFVIPQRLIFDHSTGRYVGSIKVGVSEIGGPAPPRQLSAPIAFQVLEDNMATPDELLVARTGLPLSRFGIQAADAADGLTVTVASPFNPEGVPVTLKLAPSMTLDVNNSMDGLGLEATTVAVSISGLEDPTGKLVKLTVDGPAKLESQVLTLNHGGEASTEIRSIGTGTAVVRAQTAGFQTAQANVKLNIPFLTLLASGLGAVVGGLIRLLPALGKGGSNRQFFVGLAVALLVGVLIFALYAVGVNLLPFAPKVQVGAVLVFAVSAAGAYLGARLLGPPGD